MQAPYSRADMAELVSRLSGIPVRARLNPHGATKALALELAAQKARQK